MDSLTSNGTMTSSAVSDSNRNNMLGAGVKFSRIRRVTGYLSEAVNFNNGKAAELRDRVKHTKS